jgi:hypothetical protein
MAETLRQRIEQMRNEALEKSTADWVLDLNYALEAPDDDGDRYDVLALTDQLVYERGRYDDLFHEVNSYRAQLPRDAKLRAFADSMTPEKWATVVRLLREEQGPVEYEDGCTHCVAEEEDRA